MEKRVKQEAQSILANCNLKIFGKLEDPGDTKKFFHDHVGEGFVYEMNGMTAKTDTVSSLFMNKPFYDNYGTSGVMLRVRAAYDHLRGQREGEVHMLFAEFIARVRMFYAVPDKVNALRVHRLLPVPATTTLTQSRERMISEVAARLKDPDWTAASAAPTAAAATEIDALAASFAAGGKTGLSAPQSAMVAVGGLPKVVSEKPARLPEAATPSAQTSIQPVSMAWEEKAPAAAAPKAATFEDIEVAPLYEAAAQEKRGYVPPEIDMSVVPSVREESEGPDITKLKLPENLAGVIEGMADKLNKGLGGKEKQAE